MLQMEAGAAVSMATESGRLVLEPCAGKKYSLQELLDQSDAPALQSFEDSVWTSSVAAGRELV